MVSCPICHSRRESSSVPASTYLPLGENVANDLRQEKKNEQGEGGEGGSFGHYNRVMPWQRLKLKTTSLSSEAGAVTSRVFSFFPTRAATVQQGSKVVATLREKYGYSSLCMVHLLEIDTLLQSRRGQRRVKWGNTKHTRERRIRHVMDINRSKRIPNRLSSGGVTVGRFQHR